MQQPAVAASRLTIRVALLVICASAVAGCVSNAGDTEEVSFAGAGGTKLRGMLMLPSDRSAPVPAVVLLPGAEPATRNRFVYRMHANIFVDRGMVAVAMLRQRPEIDSDRIGLVGASESGWLTPEIAERNDGIAFVINKVGSAISWRDTVAWEVYNDLQAEGASEASAREQSEVFRRISSASTLRCSISTAATTSTCRPRSAPRGSRSWHRRDDRSPFTSSRAKGTAQPEG